MSVLPDWINVYYVKPPSFIYYVSSIIPSHERSRTIPGVLWWGNR